MGFFLEKRDKHSALIGKFHRCPRQKTLDGTSNMLLDLRVTCRVIMGGASITLWHIANALTKRAAILDFGDISVTQEHYGVLLLIARAEQWHVIPIDSNTSHWMRMAAISKSELVMDPLGFLSLTTSRLMSSYHSNLHTMVGYSPVVLIPTLTDPSPEASMFTTP